MLYGPILAAALFAAAPTQNPRDIVRSEVSAPNAAAVPAPLHAVPGVGETAPDFAYQSRDFLWQRFHNMLDQGSVLLVFGAGEDQLRAIERDEEDLVARGIIPVAIVGEKPGDVWRIVRRHNLTYSLIADPNAVIADQYGANDPATGKPRPLWFVIDHKGRVRGAGEGPAVVRDWTAVAAQALGLGDLRNASAH